MPSLSKKKGRRRFNPKKEAAIAQRVLQKDKQEKFLKSMLNSYTAKCIYCKSEKRHSL